MSRVRIVLFFIQALQRIGKITNYQYEIMPVSFVPFIIH
jgi:hypothetical protein